MTWLTKRRSSQIRGGLLNALKDGPVAYAEMVEYAREQGFTERSLSLPGNGWGLSSACLKALSTGCACQRLRDLVGTETSSLLRTETPRGGSAAQCSTLAILSSTSPTMPITSW